MSRIQLKNDLLDLVSCVKLRGQNQAELAVPALLYFGLPYKRKQSIFRVCKKIMQIIKSNPVHLNKSVYPFIENDSWFTFHIYFHLEVERIIFFRPKKISILPFAFLLRLVSWALFLPPYFKGWHPKIILYNPLFFLASFLFSIGSSFLCIL